MGLLGFCCVGGTLLLELLTARRKELDSIDEYRVEGPRQTFFAVRARPLAVLKFKYFLNNAGTIIITYILDYNRRGTRPVCEHISRILGEQNPSFLMNEPSVSTLNRIQTMNFTLG
jgi:hypothetical protein